MQRLVIHVRHGTRPLTFYSAMLKPYSSLGPEGRPVGHKFSTLCWMGLKAQCQVKIGPCCGELQHIQWIFQMVVYIYICSFLHFPHILALSFCGQREISIFPFSFLVVTKKVVMDQHRRKSGSYLSSLELSSLHDDYLTCALHATRLQRTQNAFTIPNSMRFSCQINFSKNDVHTLSYFMSCYGG